MQMPNRASMDWPSSGLSLYFGYFLPSRLFLTKNHLKRSLGYLQQVAGECKARQLGLTGTNLRGKRAHVHLVSCGFLQFSDIFCGLCLPCSLGKRRRICKNQAKSEEKRLKSPDSKVLWVSSSKPLRTTKPAKPDRFLFSRCRGLSGCAQSTSINWSRQSIMKRKGLDKHPVFGVLQGLLLVRGRHRRSSARTLNLCLQKYYLLTPVVPVSVRSVYSLSHELLGPGLSAVFSRTNWSHQ